MAQLPWDEIRDRAFAFSKDWEDAESERAEKQTFLDEFFRVFGQRRRGVARFEEKVKKPTGHYGFIDLFWPGLLLIEHKSRGEDLGRAKSQAFDYIRDLIAEGRVEEVPRYVLLSDFQRFALHDLEPESQRDLPLGDRIGSTLSPLEFPLGKLHEHIRAFGFIAGRQAQRYAESDPINLKAVEVMAGLHDALEEGGYRGHHLERFLVRVLFCLFADRTGIFEPGSFQLLIENHTRRDGSDLGALLIRLFEVLNTPVPERQKSLDERLNAFPYVNGALFSEGLRFPDFNAKMRQALLTCASKDWSRISPAIFGSLFQGVMDKRERRQIGAHYTLESNILKVIRPLFLDGLRAELDNIKTDRSSRRAARLEEFHDRLAALRFFDPACGCGNFLIVAYRELRLLEIDLLRARYENAGQIAALSLLCRLDVDRFYGIEVEEWPALIAEVALWLTDHQMNLAVSEAFGQYLARIPLQNSPRIVHGNALARDWATVLPPGDCSYVLGNPPFVGKKEQNAAQKVDMARVWGDVKGAGILDYVSAWYRLAARYIRGTAVQVGFVSTNSIVQGEQVAVLWNELINRLGIEVRFAHTTFAWQSEARGKAHVHVVIIGFSMAPKKEEPKPDEKVPEPASCVLFEYDSPKGAAHASTVGRINPYLADAPDVFLFGRRTPLNGAPGVCYGSMMIDKDRQDGDEAGLILSASHRASLLAECPELEPFIRPLYGGEEFLNGVERWCLWLVGAPPGLTRKSSLLRARIEGVRRFRESSGRPQTRELALTPTLFGEIRQPGGRYLLIPKVSSESRRYIPIGFVEPEIIASGSALIVPGAGLYHFGVLSSAMHNAWMRYVAGRMKSDYQYSNAIVYNNFPWPEGGTAAQRIKATEAAQGVLDAREESPAFTLAQLYDPREMPKALVNAHRALDRAVDRLYRQEAFATDRQRVEHLFNEHRRLSSPLLPAGEQGRKRRRVASPLATKSGPL